MRISIKDVALRANVSRGTVSHVLNGNDKARIAPDTQERVRKAAEELGYIPNQMARNLFKGKTQLIGVLVSGIENPFLSALIGASERAIASEGYRRLVDASISEAAIARPELLSVWPVDGILMHAAIGRVSEGILGGRVSHVPVVYLDSPSDAHRDTVQFDLKSAMGSAAEYVIARGHRHIGIITPYDPYDLFVKQRHQALYEVAASSSVKILHLKLVDNTRQGALELGLRIAAMPAADRPTALFCHSDHIGIGVYHGIRRAGLCVPEEISIIGVDGVKEAECLDKPLSTLVSPTDDLCKIAVTMLKERIEEEVDCAPRHVAVRSIFTPRGTT